MTKETSPESKNYATLFRVAGTKL